MRLIVIILLIQLSVGLQANQHPWFDEGQADQERIEALISAMTVDEKMSQLLADSPAIERLGIPAYNWWNEALHGVARNGRATVFPQPIGLAATFDEDLVFRVATAISDEARAKFNIAQRMGNYSRYAGLTFWSPNVNLFRDPRWGRGMETYGEDPYLQARLGTAFVKGLQGDDPGHMKAAACAKHYVVHSGPEALRHEFDAVAPKKDFYESYLPAFEALVKEAGVECVMCAYNRTYGEPACGSDLLLKDILRSDWGFEGHVVSDCGAVRDFYQHHKVAKGRAEAAARALKAGTDVNCGSTYKALPEALDRGLVSEPDIDTALRRLLGARMKLGLFDEKTPWTELGAEMVEHSAHVALAREAAQKSIVLLKNAKGVLPLDNNIRNLYVTGPHAASNEVLIGNYYGVSGEMVSILEGIVAKVSPGTTVTYKYGQLPYRPNVNPKNSAIGDTRRAEATIAVLGVSGLYEGEEGSAIASPSKGDRLDLDLPDDQLVYLRKLRAASTNPLVLVLTGGSPFTTPEIEDLADAILFAWYPGQQGGAAVADVILGDVSPSGRLPVTFPASVDQLPPFEDYSMRGRTYRYMREPPLYPFGYGLSYTRFEYDGLQLSATDLNAGDPLQAQVTVRNAGRVDGTEIVQLYLSAGEAPFEVPISTLVGIRPVAIPAGGQVTVRFTIRPDQMKVFNSEGEALFAKGKHTVHAGGISPGTRGEELTGGKLQTAQFELREEVFKPYEGPSNRGADPTSLQGKVMTGYQGWFNCEGDGAGLGWTHWATNRGRHELFGPGNVTVDLWPDVSEYDEDELCTTGFTFDGETPARVFSSHNRKTVIRHFKWMADYGVDGAFVQRFTHSIDDETLRYHKDKVLSSAREGANRHGRTYAVMYDLTSTEDHKIIEVFDDWKMLVEEMHITKDPAYQHHDGKPLVAIWGVGFNNQIKIRPGFEESARLIRKFKDAGYSVMLGIPTGWRRKDRDALDVPDLHEVLLLADVLSPWTVGRYRDLPGVESHAGNYWGPDIAWARENGIDYMPVVFPGFSRHNMKGDELGAIPRLKGQFFWSQIVAAVNAGTDMLYIAMFDEVDEGTAIFKITNDSPASEEAPFLTLEGLPGDFYLRMAGEAGRLLRKEASLQESHHNLFNP